MIGMYSELALVSVIAVVIRRELREILARDGADPHALDRADRKALAWMLAAATYWVVPYDLDDWPFGWVDDAIIAAWAAWNVWKAYRS